MKNKNYSVTNKVSNQTTNAKAFVEMLYKSNKNNVRLNIMLKPNDVLWCMSIEKEELIKFFSKYRKMPKVDYVREKGRSLCVGLFFGGYCEKLENEDFIDFVNDERYQVVRNVKDYSLYKKIKKHNNKIVEQLYYKGISL